MSYIEQILGLSAGPINALYTDILNENNAERQNKYWGQQAVQSFKLNEKSANNAFERQYKLYNDLQSPSAIKQQLIDAGLNPALMYSNSGMGGHVTSAPQGGGGGNPQGISTLGLQQMVDPLTLAQINNLNADTSKKNAETNLTKAQEMTQKWTTKCEEMRSQILKQDYDFNEQTWAYRWSKIKNESDKILQEALAEQWANKITEETLDEQIEMVGQNLLNLKAIHALTISQKNLTDEQINKTLEEINLMSAQIWEISSKAELNEEELRQLVNQRTWEFISIDQALKIAEMGVETLKGVLDIIPAGKAAKFIKRMINIKSGGNKQ